MRYYKIYLWEDVFFSEEEHRRKPEPVFFLFCLPALHLRRLSKVYQRRADKPRAQDMSTQRTLEKGRAEEIGRFIHGGYPWSELSNRQKESSEYRDLRMPGWLPTAIVANILPKGSVRNGSEIKPNVIIRVEYQGMESFANLKLPKGYMGEDWNPIVPPLEIIDGQHRLFAFEHSEQ